MEQIYDMSPEPPSRERVEEEQRERDGNADAEQRIREVVLTHDRNSGLSADEVAERAGCSPSTARKYLGAMSGEYVVEAEEGNTKLYYPNPEYLRWKETFRLASSNTTDELVRKIEEVHEKVEELKNEYGVSSPDEVRMSDFESHEEIHTVMDDKAYWRSCLWSIDVLKDAVEMSERLERGRAHA